MGTAKKVGGSGDEEGSVMKDFGEMIMIGRELLRAIARRRADIRIRKRKAGLFSLCYAIIVLFYVGWISIG